MGNVGITFNGVTDTILTVLLIIFVVFLLICLIKAIIGPRVGDRVVATNMMGTMVMVIIGILAVKKKEGYLADICLIYAMISFLAVVVLTKIYIGVYREARSKKYGTKNGPAQNKDENGRKTK